MAQDWKVAQQILSGSTVASSVDTVSPVEPGIPGMEEAMEEIMEAMEEIVIEVGESLEEDTEVSCETEQSYHNYTVLGSKEFVMVSVDEESQASLVMQRLGGQRAGQVNLLCNISSSRPDLFSSGGCRPEIYLVRGRGSCSGGGAGQVTATRLAEVHRPGAGQSLVPVQWAELQDSCLLVARRDQGGDTVRPAAPPCSPAISSGPDLSRTVNTLNFNGFSILFSGRPSEWSEDRSPLALLQWTLCTAGLNIGSVTTKAVVSYAGLTFTNHNPAATLPLLQLPGLTGASAVTLALAMIGLYYSYALLTNTGAPLIPPRRSQSTFFSLVLF